MIAAPRCDQRTSRPENEDVRIHNQRLHGSTAIRNGMTLRQADILEYYLRATEGVTDVKVYDRTGDAVIFFACDRTKIITALRRFSYEKAETLAPEKTGRELSRQFEDRLTFMILRRAATKLFLPASLQAVIAAVKSVKYICQGVRALLSGRMQVETLDATAIAVSLARGDFATASSVMFLLNIGEILEDWTHKKSVDDLARTMSLRTDRVWMRVEAPRPQEKLSPCGTISNDGRSNDQFLNNCHLDGQSSNSCHLDGQSSEGGLSGHEHANDEPSEAKLQEILVPVSDVRAGDCIIVRMGGVIPLDGRVTGGECLVNQASITGESMPVRKREGSLAYAGTVVEEGECVIRVEKAMGSAQYDKIVRMIEESEKLKSATEARAAHLADRLVPYSLGGTALTYLLTRNVTKAVSVLMVDFSCALKLSMPLAVLSAMRESGTHQITVKGGKFLEAVSMADTIVFDKTGTLTHAEPTVAQVVPFHGQQADEMLRLAACLEEHYPHSMANAVVKAAMEKGLNHEEHHTKVQYVVAHGISSMVDGQKVVIGSYHFVFEDEKCVVPEEELEKFRALPAEYSQLYLAISGILSAVICIEDPIRSEAPEGIRELKELGIRKAVMMTGDSERTAKAVAAQIGVDEYFAEVLPEDKAKFIQEEHRNGRHVIMVGDGINDSPALSEADVGIAIADGAAIAREVADITISADDLWALVTLKRISDALMKRIDTNYRQIISFNAMLILLGVMGILPPATSALLHNTSTILISMKSMTDLLVT
ncbi:MAG: heavy metal translocating P-type ATPase [Lachnospiraceae bacterium]|nr:heavy metal translocating P-type ATPase [Lachnospiraceae bacterium]